MMLDICLPFNENLRCLDAAADGIAAYVAPVAQPRVLLHVQNPEQVSDAEGVFRRLKIPVKTVSVGPHPSGDMTGIMDTLFGHVAAPRVLFMEQDLFLHSGFGLFHRQFIETKAIGAGPLDSMFLNHPNARGHARFNEYSRDGVKPGYFHASFILLDTEEVRRIAGPMPFRLPPKTRLFGHGVLGGEMYYGLGVRLKDYMGRLMFLNQLHGPWGYSADLYCSMNLVATHLYYSSTREGYVRTGSLSREDCDWLAKEETRFLVDYGEKIQRDLYGR